ncbi:MAG: hypothetical protein ACE5HT_14655 [Gemmatimonadales bacterium]
MQARSSSLVAHGAIGGLVAGAVVAAWFFIADLAAGQPLRTPTILAGAFLGGRVVDPGVGMVVTYTALHFGVFVGLGIATVWSLGMLGIVPALRHGAAFGLGVLNAVHYGILLVVDANLLTLLPTVHVLGANLLGGMLMAAYFHSVSDTKVPIGPAALKIHPRLLEGLTTGFLGAVAVAVWFLVLDLLTGRPFFTPAALGSAVFLGASAPSEVHVSLGIVMGYTALHVIAFCAVGVVLVYVSKQLEAMPGLWLLVVMAFIVVEGGFLAAVGMLGGWVHGAVGWWAVVIGNLLAVTAMGRRIWRAHPGLREKLIEQPVSTMV